MLPGFGRIRAALFRLVAAPRFARFGSLAFGDRFKYTAPEHIELGQGVSFGDDVKVYAHNRGRVVIGDRVSVNSNVQIGAAEDGEIVIGNDVLIGPNVVIRASDHRYERRSVPINKQGHTGGKIVISDDVWIAANVVITAGVMIGIGAVIAAGAVVVEDIPAFALAGGVPARVLRLVARTDDEDADSPD